MGRADIKKLWAEHGGETHGPRVETVTMPEHLFWGFVEAITAARRLDHIVDADDMVGRPALTHDQALIDHVLAAA